MIAVEAWDEKPQAQPRRLGHPLSFSSGRRNVESALAQASLERRTTVGTSPTMATSG